MPNFIQIGPFTASNMAADDVVNQLPVSNSTKLLWSEGPFVCVKFCEDTSIQGWDIPISQKRRSPYWKFTSVLYFVPASRLASACQLISFESFHPSRNYDVISFLRWRMSGMLVCRWGLSYLLKYGIDRTYSFRGLTEIAGVDIDGGICRGGHCRSRHWRRKLHWSSAIAKLLIVLQS